MSEPAPHQLREISAYIVASLRASATGASKVSQEISGTASCNGQGFRLEEVARFALTCLGGPDLIQRNTRYAHPKTKDHYG